MCVPGPPNPTLLASRGRLSQYIMMSQEAGSNPPQETGLMTNSWYGKFHLEMRWHHQFHFELWGRGALARRADSFFDAVREPARDFTKRRYLPTATAHFLTACAPCCPTPSHATGVARPCWQPVLLRV